ncbi:hypothetical protein HYALB_00000016 [Hymenoscyphus albidus]|uniref:Uncharacterized protein n=1 Tax=Hymenoscyphus albidus TaxID=595503 RepID=A0A9N9LIL7_9HELO|nr:hypothetical protein HYALB_00000016 [Hymenoscyphus albidus]
MSTIPARTRSLRKPSEIGSKYGSSNGKTTPAEVPERSTTTRSSAGETSRLPTVRTRPTSLYGRPPPSASAGTNGIATKSSIRTPTSISGRPASIDLSRRLSTTKSAAPPSNAEPIKKDRSRPPVTQIRHLRNSSTNSVSPSASPASSTSRISAHTRTKSLLTSSSTALRPPATREPLAEPATTRVLRSESQPKKPSFSTLQQHFSPAKNLAPKPHPASFLAPPSPSKLPSNIAISAETAKLQNELLQLHLLHKDAGAVTEEWKASAKKKLGTRFQDVVRRNDELMQSEVDETGKINAVALRKWKEEGSPGWGLDEKIQVLDEVVNGVWNLGEYNGKYARVVRKFERWLSKSQGILASREDDDTVGNEEFVFLEALEHSWKDECMTLTRKLDTWKLHLRDLRELEKGSSLATVVEEYRKLVQGMLLELGVMGEIERDVMVRESDWIKEMNDDDDEGGDVQTAGACWRASR